MKPYYHDDFATIYHGDCREILPNIQPDSADLLLTDPPYGIDFQSRAPGGRTVHGDGNHEAVRVLRRALFEAQPVLRSDAHVLVFSGWQGSAAFQEAVSGYFTLRALLIWHKGGGGAGNILHNYIRDYEVVLYAAGYEGRAIDGDGSYSSVLRFEKAGRDRLHPTEKPVDLLSHLIRRHSPTSGLVIDPFMGAGSTLAAARDMGRRSIGIEVDERYCEVAVKRLRQDVLGLSA